MKNSGMHQMKEQPTIIIPRRTTRAPAYNDNSLRGKIYIDIQHQLKREFGVASYKAIKRCQLETAKKIIEEYKAPIVLISEVRKCKSY